MEQSKTAVDTIVVGIDVGMTHTGVAHGLFRANTDTIKDLEEALLSVKSIGDWPPEYNIIHQKVPTVLSTSSVSPLIKWGFECNKDVGELASVGYTCHNHFKLEMDYKLVQKSVRAGFATEHHQKVREWYRLFLSELNRHITRVLHYTYRNGRRATFLDSHRIQYIFSVPTTWDIKTIKYFEEAIKEAKFGANLVHTYHVGFGLTEADAAAVYTMETLPDYLRDDKHFIKAGDVIVVADLGGGTADITILEIVQRTYGTYIMEQLVSVAGSEVGATNIDKAILDLLLKDLPHENTVNCDVNSTRHKEECEQYEDYHHTRRCVIRYHDDYDRRWKRNPALQTQVIAIKESFGKLEAELPFFDFNVIVPRVEEVDVESLTYPQWGIEKGKKRLSKECIAHLFDQQLDRPYDETRPGIYQLIDRQFSDRIYLQKHNSQIYISLTGGFSRSVYIQQQIRARYQDRLHNDALITPENPHLAVCYGLVYNQLYRLGSNIPVFVRRSRESYGITYNEPHAMDKHGYMRTEKDSLDGRHWVKDMIHWMIRRNDRLEGSLAPPFAPFTIHRNFPTDVEVINFDVPIVQFVGVNDEHCDLPGYLIGENVKRIGRISCQFPLTIKDLAVLKKKRTVNGGVRRLGRSYFDVEFEIKLKVGDASLAMFEVWFNGRKVSTATGDGLNIEVDRSFHDRCHWPKFDRNDSMSSYGTIGTFDEGRDRGVYRGTMM